MNCYEYFGKTLEDVTENALNELSLKQEDVVILENNDLKVGMFSKKKVGIMLYKKEDIALYIRNILVETTKLMGIEIKLETKIRDSHISFKMFSDKNSILIGKEGQTLLALQNIIKQNLIIKYNLRINVLLDVEQYKENQNKSLEYLARRTAKEVATTKIEVKLDSMNSYQRRIIHNSLKDFRGAYSTSEGQEPNRYIVIKPKED